jgi:putative NIF3 family GTP cyclohydrolase 1 type 2
MPRLGDVVVALERRYDPSWAAEWDSVGLVCGDPDVEVSRVHVAVDPVGVVIDGGAARPARGRPPHRLVTNGVALYVAHTNADVARPGVSDALAETIGLRDVRQIDAAAERGLGRIGELAKPLSLREFTAAAAKALPATRWGVRAAGDPDRVVSTVAVCGGSGGDLAEAAAAAGADLLLTSDLKHHRTSEAIAETGIALADAAHWATEQPWVLLAAALLFEDLREAGTTVETTPSTTVTDPWTLHAHSPEAL